MMTLRFLQKLLPVVPLLAFSDALTAQTESPQNAPSSRRSAQTPQILYWIWNTPEAVKDGGHLAKLEKVAKSPFTHVSIYMLNGFGFDDPEKIKPALAPAVARAHQLGLRIIVSPYYPAHSPALLKGRLSGMILDSEATLDERGHAVVEARAGALREKKPVGSTLLKAYAFRKTSDGFYDPASLRELGNDALKITSLGTDGLRIETDQGPAHKGETLLVMTRHDYPYGDMFSDFWPEQLRRMLDTWADIPIDGVALDEFRYLTLNWGKPFRGRWYSDPMAAAYQERFNRPMGEDLLAYRYAPEGKPEVRAAAINRYFDLLAGRPAEVDRIYMEHARKLFGPDIFLGFHNTWHNGMAGDEIWGTGVNWWGLDREFGQLDESCGEPVRLGVAVAYPKPVFYNMFYSEIARKKRLDEPGSYIREAVAQARLNGRVNYLGLDQPSQWGVSIDGPLLERIGRVERRIRLLNAFNGPRPDTRLLVLFGFPSLANWFPNTASRSPQDINSSLGVEKKAQALWNAGIPCAVMSSSVIDSGKLRLGADGKPTINGHTFDAVAFIGPEYSKPETLEFLKKYVGSGGKLLLDGELTRGFDGKPVGADAVAITKAAFARDCTPASAAKLGLARNWPKEGCRLEDGSVILVDEATIETDEPHEFAFAIGDHRYTVVASGLVAFKATPEGNPGKLAAARLVSISRDGTVVYAPANPADTAIEWTSSGVRPLPDGSL